MDQLESSPSSVCLLKLLGSWASSYTHRVQLALKLKGLYFDYAEEDFSNKSPDLLLHNPIYKKVPVLLHCGRPVVESAIIIQYLDDAWPDSRPIMPADPYDRALARFWCHFSDDKLGPAVGAVFTSFGDGQKAAVEQVRENLATIERELTEGAFKGRRFFGGDEVGFLDIIVGCGSYWLAVFEEVMDVKLIDPEAFPLFHAWLRNFEEQPEVKDTIPSIDRLLEYARGVRHMMLSLAAGASVTNDATSGAAASAATEIPVKTAGAPTVINNDIVVDT